MLFLANLFLFRIFILIIVELPSLHITAFVKVLLLCPYVTAQCVFSPDMLNDQKKKRKEKKINRNCMIEILPWPFFCPKLTHCGWTIFLWGIWSRLMIGLKDWLKSKGMTCTGWKGFYLWAILKSAMFSRFSSIFSVWYVPSWWSVILDTDFGFFRFSLNFSKGVHSILDGSPGKTWEPNEKRINKLVFIGKNLDETTLRKGFKGCLVWGMGVCYPPVSYDWDRA